jgi:hypothetical protein
MVCKLILRQARKSAIKGNFSKAINILAEIDGISETSPSCREKQEQMRREFEPRLPGAAMTPRSNGDSDRTSTGKSTSKDKKPSKQTGIDNPYE